VGRHLRTSSAERRQQSRIRTQLERAARFTLT
jgi:hypothetical protein